MWRKILHNLKHNNFPVTITEAEIARLWALTPETSIRREKQVFRHHHPDWFLLGTQTALRWSDWRNRQFRFIHIGEGQYNLQFVQEKPTTPLNTLSGLAVDILKRYDWAMPAVFSPAGTMQHLDALARAAGIDKHLTSHRRRILHPAEAAKRARGVIMRITGHRTEKTTSGTLASHTRSTPTSCAAPTRYVRNQKIRVKAPSISQHRIPPA